MHFMQSLGGADCHYTTSPAVVEVHINPELSLRPPHTAPVELYTTKCWLATGLIQSKTNLVRHGILTMVASFELSKRNYRSFEATLYHRNVYGNCQCHYRKAVLNQDSKYWWGSSSQTYTDNHSSYSPIKTGAKPRFSLFLDTMP